MEINSSFFSGLGFGFCVGISLYTLKKYNRALRVLKKYPSLTGCKLIFVVRTDLNMSKGKIAAQCGHAAVEAYKAVQISQVDFLRLWELTSQTKIALKTDSVKEMLKIEENAKRMGLVTSLIHDDGRTQVPHNTATVLGIGPAPPAILNKVTGHLKLL